MSREIKFRGKRVDTGEWVEGGILYNQFAENAYIIGGSTYFDGLGTYYELSISVIPETVGQFTGNYGENLCQGDIIKGVHKTTGEKIIGSIVWNDVNYQWGVKLSNWIMSLPMLIDCYDFENVGNIHDNPELLKNIGLGD